MWLSMAGHLRLRIGLCPRRPHAHPHVSRHSSDYSSSQEQVSLSCHIRVLCMTLLTMCANSSHVLSPQLQELACARELLRLPAHHPGALDANHHPPPCRRSGRCCAGMYATYTCMKIVHCTVLTGSLATLAQAGLQDASATGRKTARECFVAFREHWPDEADRCAAAAAAAIYPSLPAHLMHVTAFTSTWTHALAV